MTMTMTKTIETLDELRRHQKDRFTELMNTCGMFFAFSDKQFQENKTPIEESDKYVAISGGGYLPKSKSLDYVKGSSEIIKWFEVEAQKFKTELIEFELNNHECFYTGDIEPAFLALPNNFTRKEVLTVYQRMCNERQD